MFPTEKPNEELAKAFIASGDFLWNAGIFTWKVKNIVAALEKYAPELFEIFAAEKDKFNGPHEKEMVEAIYPQCTNISIDFAVMEKADPRHIWMERSGYLEQRLGQYGKRLFRQCSGGQSCNGGRCE